MKQIDCPNCNGTGLEVPDCETCEGRGWVEDEEDGGTMNCPDCNNETCSTCEGSTFIDIEEPK